MQFSGVSDGASSFIPVVPRDLEEGYERGHDRVSEHDEAHGHDPGLDLVHVDSEELLDGTVLRPIGKRGPKRIDHPDGLLDHLVLLMVALSLVSLSSGSVSLSMSVSVSVLVLVSLIFCW